MPLPHIIYLKLQQTSWFRPNMNSVNFKLLQLWKMAYSSDYCTCVCVQYSTGHNCLVRPIESLFTLIIGLPDAPSLYCYFSYTQETALLIWHVFYLSRDDFKSCKQIYNRDTIRYGYTIICTIEFTPTALRTSVWREDAVCLNAERNNCLTTVCQIIQLLL